MNATTTTSIGVTIAGATATLIWLAKTHGIMVPESVAGFGAALIFGATHGAWNILTVFVPRLGGSGVQPTAKPTPNVGG